MSRAEVVIAGAGPAGLMLAAELSRAGVAVVVLERDPVRPSYCRGFNLNARALDLLSRRGLADEMIAEGWTVPYAAYAGLPVTLGLPGTWTDHPYSLGIPQTRVEEILEGHARELGADVRRGHELMAATQDADGVEVTVAAGEGEYTIAAAYLAGCDGSRSLVRKQAGIDFPGTPSTHWTLLGDVELAEPGTLPFGPTNGLFVIPRPGYVRIITADPDPSAPVTRERFGAVVDHAAGRAVGIGAVRWLTRFGDAARLAGAYVQGRIVLAGDASHIHPPAGAIGVNVALDDAFNLGWKLAATVRGTAPAHLLDSYHTERHAAGEQILAAARAQALLGQDADRLAPLKDLLTRVASRPDGNRVLAEAFTGLDTRYPMTAGGDDPDLGRLAPDLTVVTGPGPVRLATLLESAHGVLAGPGMTAAGYEGRIDVVDGTLDRPGLHAVLVRPDGHIAWTATAAGDAGPAAAIRHWFG